MMPALTAVGGLTLLPWLEWQSCLAGAAAGLGYVLAEMQSLARAHPQGVW